MKKKKPQTPDIASGKPSGQTPAQTPVKPLAETQKPLSTSDQKPHGEATNKTAVEKAPRDQPQVDKSHVDKPQEDKPKSGGTQKPNGPNGPKDQSPKPKRWRRRIVRVLVVCIVLLFLFRLSLVWVVPAVIDRAANHYGLSASVERVELSILGTDAGLWHLKVSPKEGGKELASIDYVRVKVATWALLTGNLHLRRAEAEGVTLELHRTADGRLPLLDRVLEALPEAKNKEKKKSSLSLAPPLQVDAMRLTNLKVVFFDEMANPSIKSDVNVNLTLTDLDSPVRPTRFDLELRAEPILDFLHIQGTAQTSDEELKADLKVNLRGLHPHAIDGYLRLAGLKPVAKQINANFLGNVHLSLVEASTSQPDATQPSTTQADSIEVTSSQPVPNQSASQPVVAIKNDASNGERLLTAVQGTIALRDISLTADSQQAFELEKMTLDISTLNGNLANCAMLEIEGIKGHASRNAQGKIQFAGIAIDADRSADAGFAAKMDAPAKVNAPTDVTISEASNEQPRAAMENTSTDAASSQPAAAASNVTNTSAATADTTSPPATQPVASTSSVSIMSKTDARPSNFRWRLGGADLKRITLSFHDAMVTPAVDLSLALDHLTLSASDAQHFDVDTLVNISGQGSAPGMAGSIELDGEFRPFQTPLDLKAHLKVAHIQPKAIEPYLLMLKVESQMNDATLAMDLQASWTPDARGDVSGDLLLKNVTLQDNGPLFELDQLSVENLTVAGDLKRISVDAIQLQGTRVKARRESSGNIHILGFRTSTPVVAQTNPYAVNPDETKPEDAKQADTKLADSDAQVKQPAEVAKLATVLALEQMAPVVQIKTPVQSLALQTVSPAAPTTQSTQSFAEVSQVQDGKLTNEDVAAVSLGPLDVLSTLPHVTIGSFSWRDVDLVWDDQKLSPAIISHIKEGGVLLTDFVFDPAAEALSGKPASLRLWADAKDVIGNINLTGEILAGGKGVSLRLDMLADELQSDVIKPYLEPYGFEPVLAQGRLAMTGQAQVVRGPERWQVGAKLDRLKLTEGHQTLASVDSLELVGLTLRDGRLATEQLEILKPYLQAARNADGSFALLGIKIHPGAQLPPPAKDMLTNLVESFSHIQGSVTQFKVSGATLDWQDDAVTPVVKARTVVHSTLKDFELGHGHASGEFDTRVSVSDAVNQLRVYGGLSLVKDSPYIKLSVTGDGLNPQTVKSYLPGGMRLPWHDGKLKLGIEASFSEHELGGHRFYVAVSDFDLREANNAQPIVALKDATVEFNRYDPFGGVVDVAQISGHGFETHVHRASDGQLTAGGVSFVTAPQPEQPDKNNTSSQDPSASTQPAATQPATTEPVPVQVVTAAATSSSPLQADNESDTEIVDSPQTSADTLSAELAAILAKRRQTAPLITLRKLDLHVAQISLTDEMREKSSPLVIKNMHLVNNEKIELLGPAASTNPPVKMKLELEPSPIAKTVEVDFIAKPFDEQFKFGMSIVVKGINGQGLLSVLPELAEQVKADDLVDGVLETRFGMAAKLDRPRPWLIDISRGGVINFGMGQTSLRQSPEGLVLGGVKEVRIEDIQITPHWKQIRIQNADISGLTFNGWRDKQGLHMMGFTLPMVDEAQSGAASPAQNQDTVQAVSTSEAIEVTDTSSTPVDATDVKDVQDVKPQPPAILVYLNRLTISGLDGKFEDRLVTPVMVLPLTGLDVDVRHVSNSFATQAKPLRFNVLLTAGKVKVPVRENGLNVTGVLGDTARFLTGNQTKTRRVSLVDRDLFSQITASGRIRFNPKPDGWVKLSINGLELWPLRGATSAYGVELGGGVLDLTVDSRIEDNGDLVTKNRVILTDLSLREQSNGPISRYLALPAPLDAVLVAVRSSDGAITLPLNLTIRKGQVSQSQVMRQVLNAMSRVLAKAFTSSPLKIAGGVSSFVGVGSLMGGKQAKAYEPVVISYLPGHTAPEPPFSGIFDRLIKRMKSDAKLNLVLRSQISLSDVQVASVRANPTQEECKQMIVELSQRVRALSFSRAEVAGQVKAELASMASESAQKNMLKLRALDRQLVRTQEALDGVYELLRPGSPRQAMRRTRAAAIAIGQARLEYLALKLYESGISNPLERVQLTPSQFNPIDSSAEETLSKAIQKETAEEAERSEQVQANDASETKDVNQNEDTDRQNLTDNETNDSTVQAPVILPAQEDPAAMLGQVVITLVPTR